jgi:hypothetical protein
MHAPLPDVADRIGYLGLEIGLVVDVCECD